MMAPVTESHVIEGGDSSILTAPLPPIKGLGMEESAISD